MPRSHRRLLPVLAVAALAACDASSPGPGSSASAPLRPRFAFVSNNFSPFWIIAQKGLEKARQEFGIDVEFRAPRSGKLDEQRQILEDLLAKGIDGVAVSPIDPDGIADLLDRLADRCPLVCHDSDAPRSKRRCYIGTDNVKAGREAAKAMKEAIGEAGGKVALFVGRLDAQNAQERRQGFLDEILGSKIELVRDYLDYTDRARAAQHAREALQSQTNLVGLLGLWSYNGPALAAALRDSDKLGRVAIVCFDEDEATLQGLQDGVIHATIVQKPLEFGYQSMRVLKAIRDGQADTVIPPGKIIDTGVEVVRRTSVIDFQKRLKDLLK
mgnify:CR=1 FL=1